MSRTLDGLSRRGNEAAVGMQGASCGRAIPHPGPRGGLTKIFVFFVGLVCKDHLHPPSGGYL